MAKVHAAGAQGDDLSRFKLRGIMMAALPGFFAMERLIWPAIIGGVYHAAIPPIVLLEMERAGNSFLGAVDMPGLAMVSAGITPANIISSSRGKKAKQPSPTS